MSDIREHILPDGTTILQKLWKASDGLGPQYWCPAQSCVFCDHCTDIFYDYSNGPYAFICELDEGNDVDDDFQTEKGAIGECECFIESEGEDV